MKNVLLIYVGFTIASFLSCSKPSVYKQDMVNDILGDVSFISKFGYAPDATTNDQLRIQTHLAYVEKLLRQKSASGLTSELQQSRKQSLELLHQYWSAGIFPGNYDCDNRAPCFIDKQNRICAVGYLIEKTAGRQAAEEINSRHQYDKILEMNDEEVDRWISASGLTKQEVAMIQPYYGPWYHIEPAYGISTAIFSGLNVSMSTINGIQIANGAGNKAVPIVGLVSGSGQFIMGLAKFNTTNSDVNESERAISMVNIGIGTTTMMLSTWNLIANRKPKDKLTSWNIFSFPTKNNSLGMGICFAKKF